MKYSTGELIQVGDEVLIEHGKTPGVIDTIVVTTEEMAQWNVNEAGVLIKAAPFGLVFWPLSNISDPVVLRKYANT